MALAKSKVVDCTLRDGGYCNEWQWTRDQARDCYCAAVACGAAACEVGFRRSTPEKGPLYHCPEALLHDWFDDVKSSTCALAVMAQMGTFSVANDFVPAAESPVDMVRVLVAYHGKNEDDSVLDVNLIRDSVEACVALKKLGYAVSLNVGRAEKLTRAMWADILAMVAGSVDALYFADTYGAVEPAQIRLLHNACRIAKVPSGFHFHNNTEDANLKARFAVDCGCDYIDGTMGGYGRGSGNTKLEYICQHPMPVLGFVDKWLFGYQDKQLEPFQGYNVIYFMTAKRGFHVNYANELIQDGTKRTVSEVDAAFGRMQADGKGAHYVKNLLGTYWGN